MRRPARLLWCRRSLCSSRMRRVLPTTSPDAETSPLRSAVHSALSLSVIRSTLPWPRLSGLWRRLPPALSRLRLWRLRWSTRRLGQRLRALWSRIQKHSFRALWQCALRPIGTLLLIQQQGLRQIRAFQATPENEALKPSWIISTSGSPAFAMSAFLSGRAARAVDRASANAAFFAITLVDVASLDGRPLAGSKR